MTTINQLKQIADHIRNLPTRQNKTEYLNLQSREILNFLASNIRKDGIARTTANEIPKSIVSQSTMEDIVSVFATASKLSGRNDKITEMKRIVLSPEDKQFVLTALYGSLKLGVSVPIPNPMFGDVFKPQLCGTSTSFNPSLYMVEQKFDGIRCIGMNIDDKIRLHSRDGKPLAIESITNELSDAIPAGCIVDGEIVASDGKFQSLKRHGNEIEYRIFDMIFLDHNSIAGIPLLYRREAFEDAVHETDKIRISPLLSLRNMPDIDKWIQSNDVEGIVAKSPDSQYVYGSRKSWIKVKPFLDATCKVTGFTKGTGKRDRNDMLGSISVIPEGSNVVTNVGTGFSDSDLIQMRQLLRENRNVVVDIKYQNWTTDGCMRFPVFLRIKEVTQ